MKKIKDLEGREWIIRLNLAAYKRIRANHIENFLENEKLVGEHLSLLASDKCKLCEVLWEMVAGQAKRDDITEDDFFTSFGPEVLEETFLAVVEAVDDFFPYYAPMTSRIVAEVMENREKIRKEIEEQVAKIPRGKLVPLDMDGLRKVLSSMQES